MHSEAMSYLTQTHFVPHIPVIHRLIPELGPLLHLG